MTPRGWRFAGTVKRLLFAWLALDALILAALAYGGGDRSTCDHPALRTDGPVVW